MEKHIRTLVIKLSFSYQDLTNFIRPLVGDQASVDLSKLIPDVHQPWKHQQNTPTKQVKENTTEKKIS